MKYLIAVLCFFISLSAVNEKSFSRCLEKLPQDLLKLPQEVSNISVYGVLKDSKNRYDSQKLKAAADEIIRKAERFSYIDRSDAAEASEELKLSASGAIDYSQVKEMGRMANIDAFVFIYPQISGKYNRRLTILVQVVQTATSRILMIKKYVLEEASIMNIGLAFHQPIADTLDSKSRFSIAASEDDVILPMKQGFLLVNSIPVFTTALHHPVKSYGINFELSLQNLKNTLQNVYEMPGTAVHFGSNIDKVISIRTSITVFKPSFCIDLPVSQWFGDTRRTLNLSLGGGIYHVFASSRPADGSGIEFDKYTHLRGQMDGKFMYKLAFEQKRLKKTTAFFRSALELRLASTVSFLLQLDVIPEVKMTVTDKLYQGTFDGAVNPYPNQSKWQYSSKAGFTLRAGISYSFGLW